ncbi:MAG: flagellar motor switch protein FliN [Thermodesulfobacteriota bacterium]
MMQELTNEQRLETGSGPSEVRGLEERVSSLDMILDIPVHVTVELGRTKMPIKDVIQLTQGSVVELSKMAGEHLEVLINDKLIAKGEVVVVNDRFGIRISEILSPAKRLEQLG